MNKKRILIALYYDYHLFGYFLHLIPILIQQGFRVDMITCCPNVHAKYQSLANSTCFNIYYKPLLRPLIRLIEHPIFRPLIWIYGWLWSGFTVRGYDAVIVPRDGRPFQHMMSAWKPSLVCQPGLGNDEKRYLIHKYKGTIPFPVPRINTLRPWTDRIFGGSYHRVVRGPENLKYYTVTGEDFKEYYSRLGIPEQNIFITGNPNYENLMHSALQAPLGHDDLMEFGIEINKNDKVFVFFSSHLSFSEQQLATLKTYIESLEKYYGDLSFILKIHPRMTVEAKNELITWAQTFSRANIHILSELKGDENNMKLIQFCEAACVESSNVGVLAAWLEKPLLVIDLDQKGYDVDNLFCLFDGVLDIRNLDEIEERLSRAKMPQVIEAQNNMVNHISKKLESPNQKIVDVLNSILDP